MGAGVRVLIGETTVTLYAYQREEAWIVGVASTADATRIGRGNRRTQRLPHRYATRIESTPIHGQGSEISWKASQYFRHPLPFCIYNRMKGGRWFQSDLRT